MMFPNLKVGDKVLRHHDKPILSGGWGTGFDVPVILEETVFRVTAKTALTETGIRFALDDGNIHASRTGMRIFMYPVGYVRPDARSAVEMRPLTATSEARLAELTEAANHVKNLTAALTRLNRNEGKIIKHVLRTHGVVEGAAMLKELKLKIDALLEGFRA